MSVYIFAGERVKDAYSRDDLPGGSNVSVAVLADIDLVFVALRVLQK